jgi:multicomponent Na+:H+ antiporter subunit C
VNVNLSLLGVVAVLFGCGVALLLERSLTRVVLGVVLLSNGANLLILAAGRPGGPPIHGVTPESDMSDPLAQAMVLTAIVITLGVTSFLLAMAYRNWQFLGHDEVQDDIEDRRIRRMAVQDEVAAESDAEAPEIDPVRFVLRRDRGNDK